MGVTFTGAFPNEDLSRARQTCRRNDQGAALSPSTLDGGRSWVFYDRHLGYDYLTQLPPGPKGSGIEGKELMFGGGFFQGGGDGLGELGCVDDSKYNPGVAAHIAGSLPILFGGKSWGLRG